MKEKKGLLVMAYGTPYKEEDIEPYYTHIRRGRKPSEEALQDLKDRYEYYAGNKNVTVIRTQRVRGYGGGNIRNTKRSTTYSTDELLSTYLRVSLPHFSGR